MRFLIIFLIISMVLISAQNAFALPAKMDCASILDEWARVNYLSGNFVHDIIPPVIIDGKNTSFFIKAEQSTKNDDHIQLEMKLLDRNDHIMENSKFFVELLQGNETIHRDLFYTSSGTLVLDFDQNNSTKETTIDAEQANMGYLSSSSDHITVNSPILDGLYQLKVTAMGACDKMVFFFPQEAVPVFQGSFLASDGHVNGVAVLIDNNQGIFGPPVTEIPKWLSPLKQFESGVPIDEIQCKEGLQLIFKASNGNPACVKQETLQKLIERGWVDLPPDHGTGVVSFDSKLICNKEPETPLTTIPILGDPQRQVFFVKTNSVSNLCIEYTSSLDNEGMFSLSTELFSNYYSQYAAPVDEAKLTVTPNSVSLGYGSNVTAVYTIVTGNKTGTYWLPQSQMCDAIPIVVYSDMPYVAPSEIPVVIGMHGCPIKQLDAEITGYSGGIMKYMPAKALPGR